MLVNTTLLRHASYTALFSSRNSSLIRTSNSATPRQKPWFARSAKAFGLPYTLPTYQSSSGALLLSIGSTSTTIFLTLHSTGNRHGKWSTARPQMSPGSALLDAGSLSSAARTSSLITSYHPEANHASIWALVSHRVARAGTAGRRICATARCFALATVCSTKPSCLCAHTINAFLASTIQHRVPRCCRNCTATLILHDKHTMNFSNCHCSTMMTTTMQTTLIQIKHRIATFPSGTQKAAPSWNGKPLRTPLPSAPRLPLAGALPAVAGAPGLAGALPTLAGATPRGKTLTFLASVPIPELPPACCRRGNRNHRPLTLTTLRTPTLTGASSDHAASRTSMTSTSRSGS